MNRDVVGGMLESLGCAVVEVTMRIEHGSHPETRLTAKPVRAERGCRCQVADGAAAVEAVRTERARGTRFDVIFMDVQMPVMDGLEASVKIRVLEAEGERTPIVALTGVTGAEEQQRCVASGMDDFTTKPLSLNTCRNLMRVHAKRPSTAAASSDLVGAGAAESGAAVPPAPAAEDGKPSVDPSIFDPKDILAVVGGRTALMRRILEKFDAGPMLQAAEAALAEEDLDKLRSAAHFIKSRLKYMMAHAAAESAFALEREARALEQHRMRNWQGADHAWSEESKTRLAAMTATLCAHVERVTCNVRAVMAELG